MAVKIDTLMLRYFVAFGFDCTSPAMFNSAVNRLCENHGSVTSKPVCGTEDDFFTTINELYDNDNPAGIGEYIECSEGLPKLESADKKHHAAITRLGVYLHRNGLGILWYEAEPDSSVTNDIHTLYSFQSSFKELAIHDDPFGWRTVRNVKSEFSCESCEKRIITKAEEVKAAAEGFGINMSDKLPKKAVFLENGRVIIEYTEYSEFHQGLWINSMLDGLGGLHFLPERFKGENRTPIPDKALLCTYSLFSADTDRERKDYMFRMTNGYSEGYNINTDIDSSCISPFQGTWWYARQEGIGQYVLIDDNERRLAFHRGPALRRMENYCYLYVLVLQQHYSLLEYAARIASLSAAESMSKNQHLKKLQSCVSDMNLFFMKNTFPGVSHISHQNDVYKYLRDIYDITEFYEETKNGLEAVADMAEKYRSEQSSDRLFLCTILGAIFVIAETLLNVSDIVTLLGIGDEGSTIWWIGVGTAMGAAMLISLIIWLIWKCLK